MSTDLDRLRHLAVALLREIDRARPAISPPPVEAATDRLRAAARATGAQISADDRVTEKTAAALIGASGATLRRWRAEGAGPAYVSLPLAGCRITYRLSDLAEFLEEPDE